MRKLTRKPPLKESIKANMDSLNYMMAMAGKPAIEAHGVTGSIVNKQPRVKAARPAAVTVKPRALEADVQRGIIQYLSAHPSVLMAWRVNSGAAHTESGAPIWFYRIVRQPGESVRLPDLMGLLRDGRMFAIEVKRPGWKKPVGQREIEQQNFLRAVATHGGLAGFATSIDEANEIIEGGSNEI